MDENLHDSSDALRVSPDESQSTPEKASEVLAASSPLLDWKQQLGALRQKAQDAVQRLTEYLRRLRSPGGETGLPADIALHLEETLASLSERQDSFEELLRNNWRIDSDESPTLVTSDGSEMPSWALEFQSSVNERLLCLEARMGNVLSEPSMTAEAPPHGCAAEDADYEQELDALPSSSDEQSWLHVMLGPELSGDPRMNAAMNWLEQSVKNSHEDALCLLGQLLVFRFASTDRKPNLLKDVGEAFYRCFPKTKDTSDPFEDALAGWLRQLCEAAGLVNSIEIVHPGERFDPSKHAPLERGGVEVAKVLGWVVLRDQGRVYSKALVQTR